MAKRKTAPTPLESARKARTLSQQQMADILGIGQATWVRIEQGGPVDRGLQERIATILGVPRHEIFATEPEQVAS